MAVYHFIDYANKTITSFCLWRGC